MTIVYQVFNQCVDMMTEFFNTAMTDWGIFGTFIIFIFLLRKVAQTFNKSKGG